MSQSSSAYSPELSSLSLNLSDENAGATSSKRSNVVKKSNLKRKRKRNKELSAFMKLFTAQSQMFQDHLKSQIQMQNKMLELTELRREDKILFLNLESISNLNIREYFRVEQNRVMLKRNILQQQEDEDSSTKSLQESLDKTSFVDSKTPASQQPK